ncbi:MAG: hypothetical protein ABIB43_04960 [archaeon]
MKKLFLVILIFLLIPFSFAVTPVDVGICDKSLEAADAQVQSCIDTCTIESKPALDAYNIKQAELEGISNDPVNNCEGYAACSSFCQNKDYGFDPDDETLNPAIVLSAMASCLEETCPDAIATCEARKVQLQQGIGNDFYYAYKCVCESCILPGCRYQKMSACAELTGFCDEVRKSAFNAAYGSSVKSWIGCNSSTTNIAILTKIGTAGLTGDTKEPKKEPEPDPKITTPDNKPITTPKEPEKKLTVKQEQKKQENQQQIQKIKNKPKVEVIEVNTPEGKKEIILNNPDNSKPDIVDKAKYHLKNEIKTSISDKIGDIPIIGPYKDYIVKFFEDQQSDETKTTDTQIQLGSSKKGAQLFNMVDGTGDKELSLSPGKNLIPSTPLTKPYEWVLNELGFVVKKSMAKGLEKEYAFALNVARLQREKYGSSWSQTIKNTITFVGEELGEDPAAQTLESFSKKEYQKQDARVKAYIMQMKMNGELK